MSYLPVLRSDTQSEEPKERSITMDKLKAAGREARETLEIEVEEMVGTTKKAGRWARHNPIKVLIAIIAAIFFLK